jgi:hypothetical protein
MRQNNIKDLPRLKDENYENIFNVYTDDNDFYYYNLLQTIHFPQDLPDSFFETYDVKFNDTWPLISYKKYNSIKLWWLIALANGVVNPINFLTPGKTIKVPKPQVATEILTQIVTNRD